MSPRTLPRYNRRKALAIRRFPLGCGPNAVKLNPKHIVQTSSPGGLENVRVAIRHFPDGCSPNAVKFEDPKLREETYSPAGLENGKVSIVEELCVLCSEAAVSPDIAELQNSLTPIPLENSAGVFSDVEIQSALCLEGPFSSERQEPPHSLMSVAVENNASASNVVEDVCMLCSSGSLSSEKEELPNSLIRAALENNVAVKPENTKLEVSELVKHSSDPPKLKDGYSYLKVHEPPKWRKTSAIRQFPHGCESNGGCISKNGHQKPALQQREKGEGSAWIASSTNVLNVVENMPLVKQPIAIDGSAGIADTENILTHEDSMVNKATTTDGLAMVASVEKIAGYNRRGSIVTEGKEISIDRSILVRSNSGKNFGVEDTIGHVQIKTSVMSGSDGTLKHTSSGKILQQQEKEEDSALVASNRNILHAMENVPLVKQPIVIDGPAGIADIENTLKHENSNVNQATIMDDFVKVASIEKVVVYNRNDSNLTKGKEENIDRNILVKTNSDKNFGVDGTSGHIQINSTANNGSYGSLILPSSDKTLKQQEKEAGYALVASTKNVLHVVENMPFLKEPMVIDGSAGISDTENTLNQESSMNQATTTDGLAHLAYVPNVTAYNRKDYQVTKGKEKSIDRNILARSNTDKNLSVEGTSGHLQFKFSVMNGPDGTLKGSSSEKKLEVCKFDKAVVNLQTKAQASCSTHFVVESQIGSEPANKEFSPLVENPSVKDNEFSKKRKLPAEIYYKEPTSFVKDGASVAFGGRMVVLALMAPENCPWRKSKRQGAPAPKMKEKKLMNKNSASNEFSLSQQKNKGFIEDDNYLVEEKNRKSLTLCQKPNELSITMTPVAPLKLSQKGGDDDGEVVARHKVKRALRLFQLICRKLLQGEESNSKLGKVLRIDLQASGILKENGEWVNTGDPIIGHVPGVEIGDEFHYRVELSMVGLHRPYQGGIDCTKKNGLLVATSIVASDGYQDGMDSSDVLIYCGSGGTSSGPDKQPVDQKLERGNLALRNSIDAHTPVRVIHGFKEKGSDPHDAKGRLVSSFTYDGLYHVEKYWQARGPHGFNVFKFQLRRKAGQPELALKELKRSEKLKIRQGLCVKDISKRMEKIPLSVVNTIDTEQPMPFNYITKNIYPSWYVKTPPRGCDCTNGCSDSEKCACAVKNGGEIPYNFNGAIVQAKPLIYECGPWCKCRPSCHNRVSQHGIRMHLEIFKTGERGWGLRSLKSISSGSFICEYMGELLQDGEAEMRDNDEYLFDIGHNYDDHSLWDGLPNHIPELQLSSVCDTVENVGYTIDAAEYGNIGRFINHSCSPNLYAQNVLYDHDDKRMPHIMLFAVDNIPPLQELTYHYNYTIDQVRDSEGNIKQKACYCGSPECCGRLY